MKQHKLFISSKINKFLGILSRLRRFVPNDTLLGLQGIYWSLIQPYITQLWYCCIGPRCSNKSGGITNLKFKLLNPSLCLIQFASYRSHTIQLFNQYNILPRNFQCCKLVCTSMHDVSNNSFPANISNLFLYNYILIAITIDIAVAK